MLFQTFTSTRLLPFEQSFAIRVQPGQPKDGDEAEHHGEAVHAERANRQCPWKQKDREGIEDEKEQRDEIKRDGKLHPRRTDRLGAAFVVVALGMDTARG